MVHAYRWGDWERAGKSGRPNMTGTIAGYAAPRRGMPCYTVRFADGAKRTFTEEELVNNDLNRRGGRAKPAKTARRTAKKEAKSKTAAKKMRSI